MKKEGINKFKATIIMMTLVLSMVFVMTNMPVVNAEDLPPATSVNSISPYWQDAVPFVNLRATVTDGPADDVTLYYRDSSNGHNWGTRTKSIGVYNPDTWTPSAWTFDCPNGAGY